MDPNNSLGGKALNAEEEFEFTNTGGESREVDEFDRVVGALQDIVIDQDFEKQQNEFFDKNSHVFEQSDENNKEYMNVFQDYQDKLQNYIEKKLKTSQPDVNMKNLFTMMESRSEEVDPQLMDLLRSFSDFQLFHEHMLALKKPQDLSDLVVSGQTKPLHSQKEKEKPKEKEGKEGKQLKKENVEDKENIGSEGNIGKEVGTGDFTKSSNKKSAGKANLDSQTQQKENLFV